VTTEQVSARSEAGLQSVIKAFALIEALVGAGEASAATLAEELGEPRSSVYRMLATLQQIGVVEPGSRRGLHRPGLGLVRLGGSVLTRFDERQLLLPLMERLRAQTKETVHLALRRGYQAVFIERLHGERTHALAIKLGGVLPLHVGASPRALLAFEPDLFWEEYFAETTIDALTQSAPATEAKVREILAEIRRTGVSISDEDVVPGVATVGVPVFDHRGVVRAAIAFNLLPETLRADHAAWIDVARTASAAASLTFGYDLDAKGLPTPP
jgi:DNA-binding IclR family transcriptional regulator